MLKDRSNYGIDDILIEMDFDGHCRSISFTSWKLNRSKERNAVTEKEFLEYVQALKKMEALLKWWKSVQGNTIEL